LLGHGQSCQTVTFVQFYLSFRYEKLEAMKVEMMKEASLRSLVEKWLAPTPARPLRVTRFGRTANGVRYVRVEVLRLGGPLSIAFFYKDGAWTVIPPRTRQLGMTVTYPRAA
jgi:hypothetical protein